MHPVGHERIVIAEGVDWAEATAEAESFLTRCDLASLQKQATWRQLTTVVKVVTDRALLEQDCSASCMLRLAFGAG